MSQHVANGPLGSLWQSGQIGKPLRAEVVSVSDNAVSDNLERALESTGSGR